MRKWLAATSVGIMALFLAGCPQKQPITEKAPPKADEAAASAAATATAEAAKAAADREAADRAAASAAIGQAEKDIADAKDAKAPLFAYDLYQSAQELLATAKAEFAKPSFATARDRAVEASAKAKEAKERALAARSGNRLAVKKGQTLWGIASFRLKDPFLWPLIYQANLDLIKNPNLIYPKQEIVVPEHFGPEEGEQARKEAAAAK